jgi:hypothetical protein
MAPSDLRGELRTAVLAARNADGGWGYHAGKTSRLEPTCWALLALARSDRRAAEIGILLKWPTDKQWLSDVAGAPANISFNSLAALSLIDHPSGAPGAVLLARLILGEKGKRLEQSTVFRQDNSLQAWPWVDGTFSWVEPTCWCLLLIKKLRTQLGPEADERIGVAEAMLHDRACSDGGWNYGSSNVYGQELFPYVSTTALGLMAMQDRRADPIVMRAVRRLEAGYAAEVTPMALALTVIALDAHARPSDGPRALLAKRLSEPSADPSTLSRAMSLYALTDSSDGHAAFRL